MKFTFDREPRPRAPLRFDPLIFMLAAILIVIAAVSLGLVVNILRGL